MTHVVFIHKETAILTLFASWDALSILDDDVVDLYLDKVLIGDLERRVRAQIFSKTVFHHSFEALIIALLLHNNALHIILIFGKD